MMLGNLTIEEMETRSGIKFPDELIQFMKLRHQPLAEGVKSGEWHCFDLPFTLLCGDMETATTILNHLMPFSGDFKEPMQISIT
jgi:hypothetical protein